MNRWVDFFDAIYLINLDKRMDRYSDSLIQLQEYEIPFKRISAVEDIENGARGLRDTMVHIFNEAVEQNYKAILVLEDDFQLTENRSTVDITMSSSLNELPDNWHLLYMGCQPTGGFSYRHSPSLLNLQKAYATHACAYSQQGIKEIMAREFKYPIDNFYADEIQVLGQTYCTFQFLCQQRAGVSDIGRSWIDWSPFMKPRHEQKLAELR